MLCLHGNPTWSYLWRRFLTAAPPGWRVVAPDQLGMGWSERPTAPRRMADRIEDLNRLTEALEITGPVVVVAHDWGGPIALGWALGHLDQLVGVVLTNTGVALPERRTGRSSAPGLIRLARSAALRQTVCVSTPAFVARHPGPVPTRPARRRAGGARVAVRNGRSTTVDRRLRGRHPARARSPHPSRAGPGRGRSGRTARGAELVALGPRGPGLLRGLSERSVPAVAPRLHPAVRAGLASRHRGRSGNGRPRVALGRGSAGEYDEQSGGFRHRRTRRGTARVCDGQ